MLNRLFGGSRDEGERNGSDAALPEGPRQSDGAGQNAVMQRPRVLLVDLPSIVQTRLADAGFNVSSGTLGTKYGVDPSRDERAVMDWSLPSIEEQDVVVLDLSKPQAGLRPETGLRQAEQRAQDETVVIPAGQSYFDPRPFSSKMHESEFRRMLEHGGVVIVMADRFYSEEYYVVRVERGVVSPYGPNQLTASNFDLLPFYLRARLVEPRLDRFVQSLPEEFKPLERTLSKHAKWFQPQSTLDPVMDVPCAPLMRDKFGEMLGALAVVKGLENRDGLVLVLPPSEKPEELVYGLLSESLPTMLPQMFPEMARSTWMDSPAYLPQEVNELLDARETLRNEHEAELERLDERVRALRTAYAPLYDILAAEGTGSRLVDSLAEVFRRVGYDKVEKPDEEREEGFEEDLRLISRGKVILVEVKGISGHPSEADCGQVLKYVSRRRAVEPSVHGLFVVNHQLHLPPLQRDHPAFTEKQIRDAEISASYSLLGTWELFRAVLAFERGELALGDIDACLRTPGLVSFLPMAWTPVGTVAKVWGDPQLVSIELDDALAVSDVIGYVDDGRYKECRILSLEVGGERVADAEPSTRVGAKLDAEVPRGRKVYRVRSHT